MKFLLEQRALLTLAVGVSAMHFFHLSEGYACIAVFVAQVVLTPWLSDQA
jgi:hypothetical protein